MDFKPIIIADNADFHPQKGAALLKRLGTNDLDLSKARPTTL